MSAFASNLAVLPEAQRALWPSLSEVPKGFVLYGGTALALCLGHRQSLDFDFFTSGAFAPTDFHAAIPFLKEGTIAQSEPNALTVWVRPLPTGRAVKVSFFGGIDFPVIDRPDRPDPGGIVMMPQIVAAAVAIFPGQVDYISTMSAMTYFEDGEAKSFPEPLKKKLRAAARNASPVPVPKPSFASIAASAAAVGR